MKTNNEVKCPVCGKTGVSGELTVIDRRTGKKVAGLGTLLFGIVLVAIAVFMIVLIIILWNDRMVPGRQYIYLPIVLLIGGVPIIYSYLRADRAKIMIYKCASCGKTITQDELEGTKLAGLEVPVVRETGRATGSTKRIIWICSVIVVALAVVYLFRRSTTSERQSFTGPKMLVVLPFENLGLPEDEDLVNGITEAINTRLAGMEGLSVISHQSAMQYKNSNKTARQISQELGTDYLLYGTVRSVKSGGAENPIRLVVQLIRATDDMHIWAEPYERDLVDLSRVESDIAGKVAAQLGVAVLESER